MTKNSIVKRIRDLGFDPELVSLVGVMQHFDAGVSRQVRAANPEVPQNRILKPVVTRIDFLDATGSKAGPIFSIGLKPGFREDLTNESDFWRQDVLPAEVDRSDVTEMLKGLVQHHHELTGEVHNTRQLHGSHPRMIERILSSRTPLTIGLLHLVDFLDIQEELLQSLFVEPDDLPDGVTMKSMQEDIYYRRNCLTDVFRKQPCERLLHDALRAEYDQDHSTLGFNNYYEWFRRSEGELCTDAGLPIGLRNAVTNAIRDWMAGDLTGALQSWTPSGWVKANGERFCRSFEVHPRHTARASELLLQLAVEVMHAEADPTAEGVAEGSAEGASSHDRPVGR